MGLFGKLFGGKTESIDSLLTAVEQRRYAEARLIAEQLQEQELSAADSAELERLRVVAGDGLAALNLTEGLGFQRSGDLGRAEEHLLLAQEQACSAELQNEIRQVVASLEADEGAQVDTDNRGNGCGSCGPQATVSLGESEIVSLDDESQLELILTSYPLDLGDRYRQKSELFKQVFLLSHSGKDVAALPLWQQIAVDEQDELYWFEFGAAQARCEQLLEAQNSLERALEISPGLLLATGSLVTVLIAAGEIDSAQSHLEEMLQKGQDEAFCHAQLTIVSLQKRQPKLALEHVRQALAIGVADQEFLQLAASLLEQSGALDDAEAVLSALPGGGCGGGANLQLAEFWLRQQRELPLVLDAFNAACRQEPDNPRWQLRVAQTYLARNWNKEGLELLNKVVGDPRLTAELRQEGEQLLAEHDG